jgi:UDP-N-acetylmuramoyl-L-alanyl-D-glutamate--2,6-diaminopimelate ligase
MMAAPAAGRTMPLGELLAGIVEAVAAPRVAVHGVAQDSRRSRPGDLFLACAGASHHGLEHVAEVLAQSPAAIAYEPAPGLEYPLRLAAARGLTPIAIPELRQLAGVIAARWHGHPSRALRVVGVTGTNGKTSCTHFLAEALDGARVPCGIIGTLGSGRVGCLAGSSHTTPDAVTLQALLGQMRADDLAAVAMEVSSHGLHQGRLAGVEFEAAVFTNLSRDHLDYHGDMQAYGAAKRLLFHMADLRQAVINADDAYGRELMTTLPGHLGITAFGLSPRKVPPGARGVWAQELRLRPEGMELAVVSSWGDGVLRSPLLGAFNASNLLAVLATLLALDVPFPTALQRLGTVGTVPGRMERFGGGAQPLVVVDYAHTPDALTQALRALREHTAGRLYCVFGCGGERDRGKRPLMGAAACTLADQVIVTDDNPRGEDPEQIVAEILAGAPLPERVQVDRDRERAIRSACAAASPGDIVLVAGKGHEDYQQIGAQRRHFSDRELVCTLVGAGCAG